MIQGLTDVSPQPRRLAPALGPGARIALIAPCAPYDPAEFEAGRARLMSEGFQVQIGREHARPGALVAGTTRDRLAELHDAFTDPAVDALMAIRGGYGVMHLLPGIDWELVARHPKLLVGLSDVTPLLGALFERAGLVSLHGPMVAGLGGRTDEPSIQRLLAALTRAEPLAPMQADGDAATWCLSPGSARGTVVGGNLAMLAATAGTPFQVSARDRILLIEEVGEPPYRVDRMLVQLRLSGALDGCAGIGFGEMVGCESPDRVGYSLRDVVRDQVADLPLPVVWGLPFGHGARNWTFPVGGRAELDANEGQIRFLEAAVVPPRPSTRSAGHRA